MCASDHEGLFQREEAAFRPFLIFLCLAHGNIKAGRPVDCAFFSPLSPSRVKPVQNGSDVALDDDWHVAVAVGAASAGPAASGRADRRGHWKCGSAGNWHIFFPFACAQKAGVKERLSQKGVNYIATFLKDLLIEQVF